MCRDYKVHRALGDNPKIAQGEGGSEWWGGDDEDEETKDEVEAERHHGSWPCEARVYMGGYFNVDYWWVTRHNQLEVVDYIQ